MQSIKGLRLVGFLLLSVACLNLSSGLTVAQTSEVISSVADTSSPRTTLESFIDACNELYDLIKTDKFIRNNDELHLPISLRILDCVDSSELPAFARDERASEIAICIKEILDRVELPTWDEIPDNTAIEAAGGFEQLSRWRIPGTRLTIARVEEGPQKHEYLFTAGTADRALEYYRNESSKPYRVDGPTTSPGFYDWYMSAPGHPVIAGIVNRLSDRMRFGRSFGLANWKWPGLLVALLVVITLMVIIYRLHFALVRRTRGKRILTYCLTIIFPIAAMLVPLVFAYFADNYLTIRGNALYIVSFCANATATLAAVVVVFAGCNRIAETVIASPRVNPLGLNAQLIRISSKLASVMLSVVVMLVGGQYLGVPVATLLASAGIGGVALALGAQDTLKTLFGTMMLMGDKPFRVGERIVFKGYDGIVEDIGLRSTKIRLLNSHLVTIPNDELARSDIENVGRRRYIRRVANISIPLDTSHEKVMHAVAIIRSQLENHEGMHEDYPPRIFFLDFLPEAFTIRVIYWYHPPSYWDYLAFSERFNSEVFRSFEEQGISLSLPQRITHTSLDSEQAPIEVQMLENRRNP